MYRAMSAGAWGYLLKDAAPAELVSSIRRVVAGRTAIGPEAASLLAQRMGSLELTERELEVLKLLAAGDGNKQIGTKLGIAPGTVKAPLPICSRSSALKVGRKQWPSRSAVGWSDRTLISSQVKARKS